MGCGGGVAGVVGVWWGVVGVYLETILERPCSAASMSVSCWYDHVRNPAVRGHNRCQLDQQSVHACVCRPRALELHLCAVT